MRQHQKYQTICDYTLIISHDMSVIHEIRRYETPMQKLQEITSQKTFLGYFIRGFFVEVHMKIVKFEPRYMQKDLL